MPGGTGVMFRFCQENPKLEWRCLSTTPVRSKTWLRYESYKTAQNWDEFLSLGGKPRDFRYDMEHNYIRLTTEGELF